MMMMVMVIKMMMMMMMMMRDPPIMDTAEGLLVCDIVHEDETHGAAVVGGGDGTVPLLTSSILKNAIFEGTEEDALFYKS